MHTTAINPWSFSLALGFDQAQLVEGRRRELICSAQDSVDEHGETQHPGDLPGQLGRSLDNLEGVLAEAQMSLTDVVRLNFYTTDVPALLQNFTLVTDRFDGHRFATTVLGVAGLAGPELLIALEATAMD